MMEVHIKSEIVWMSVPPQPVARARPRQTDGSVMSQVDLLVKLQESDVVFYQDLLNRIFYLNIKLEIYPYDHHCYLLQERNFHGQLSSLS